MIPVRHAADTIVGADAVVLDAHVTGRKSFP
jgi:hypothetical protein